MSIPAEYEEICNKSKRVSELFEELAGETYYGFNMKMELLGKSDEFLDSLEMFISECKAGRTR